VGRLIVLTQTLVWLDRDPNAQCLPQGFAKAAVGLKTENLLDGHYTNFVYNLPLFYL
jgi:hypothetical protein